MKSEGSGQEKMRSVGSIDFECGYMAGRQSALGLNPCDCYLGQARKTSRFEDTGAEVGRLVAEKNQAYGDSFARSGEIMRILYPNGILPEQMDDALAVVRVVDKLFRIATRKDAFGESPWRDVAGYGILGATKSTLGTSVPESGLKGECGSGKEIRVGVPRDCGHPGDDGAAGNG